MARATTIKATTDKAKAASVKVANAKKPERVFDATPWIFVTRCIFRHLSR